MLLLVLGLSLFLRLGFLQLLLLLLHLLNELLDAATHALGQPLLHLLMILLRWRRLLEVGSVSLGEPLQLLVAFGHDDLAHFTEELDGRLGLFHRFDLLFLECADSVVVVLPLEGGRPPPEVVALVRHFGLLQVCGGRLYGCEGSLLLEALLLGRIEDFHQFRLEIVELDGDSLLDFPEECVGVDAHRLA